MLFEKLGYAAEELDANYDGNPKFAPWNLASKYLDLPIEYLTCVENSIRDDFKLNKKHMNAKLLKHFEARLKLLRMFEIDFEKNGEEIGIKDIDLPKGMVTKLVDLRGEHYLRVKDNSFVAYYSG